jgi:hypothetical protein
LHVPFDNYRGVLKLLVRGVHTLDNICVTRFSLHSAQGLSIPPGVLDW